MPYTQVLLLHLDALMLVKYILGLTFIVVVFSSVKILSETLRASILELESSILTLA